MTASSSPSPSWRSTPTTWPARTARPPGAIDEDTLYYLRSRGVPRPIATDMLVLSFLAQAVEEIAEEDLRDEINARLSAWLERRRG